MALSLLLMVLIDFLVIVSSQQVCDQELESITPSMGHAYNATDHSADGSLMCNEQFCLIPDEAFRSTMQASGCFLEWEGQGSLSFEFQLQPPLVIAEVRVWYTQRGNIYGLPRINIPSFGVIRSASGSGPTETEGNRSTTGSFSGSLMNMTFDLAQHSLIKQFCFRRIEFYTCIPATTITTTNTTASIVTTPNTGLSVTTLAIIIAASVIGFLLLLVLITVICLICVVLHRKKPANSSGVQSTRDYRRRNTYEAGLPSKWISEEKYDLPREAVESVGSPQPPSDPEYATISEWRQMAPEQPSVINKFYASSSNSLTNKSNPSDPPGYLEVVESSLSHYPPATGTTNTTERESVDNVNLGIQACSLQDVRGCVVKENLAAAQKQRQQHWQDKGAAMSSGVAGRVRMTTTVQRSQSSHELASHAVTVKRSATMKPSVSVGKPVPPPRPRVAPKRNPSMRSLGHLEVSGLQSGPHTSPLVQSMRAAGRVPDDVGNDNYITLP